MGLPGFDSERTSEALPPLNPEFLRGGMMVWNLWTCVSYTQKEGELKSVGSSWPPSEVVAPPPQLFFTFLKGILVF